MTSRKRLSHNLANASPCIVVKEKCCQVMLCRHLLVLESARLQQVEARPPIKASHEMRQQV
jgi:hypothetical protein